MTEGVNWKAVFEKWGHLVPQCIERIDGKIENTVEELYQAFAARMREEEAERVRQAIRSNYEVIIAPLHEYIDTKDQDK